VTAIGLGTAGATNHSPRFSLALKTCCIALVDAGEALAASLRRERRTETEAITSLSSIARTALDRPSFRDMQTAKKNLAYQLATNQIDISVYPPLRNQHRARHLSN
jgi:hypothetical protein